MDNPNIDTKALFAPKKGKAPTKGQKEIHEGNMSTIKTYVIVDVVCILIRLIFGKSLVLTILSSIAQLISLYVMHHMASSNGTLDLNLSGGFGDKMKDIQITMATCAFLSYFSEYFYLICLWLPAFYVYQLWVNILGPWFFAPVPEVAPEVADKKRKKMERKMARSGYR